MSAEGENNVNNTSVEEDKKADNAENDDKIDVKNTKEENDETEKTPEKAEENDEKCKGDVDAEKDEKPKEGEEKSNGENKVEEDSEKDDEGQSDDDEDEEEEEEEDEDNKDDTMDVSDQSGTKKSPKSDKDEKEAKLEIPEGKGTALGDIPRIDASLSRVKSEDLKTFHQILFNTPGKLSNLKKNIKRFNGFEFDKDSDEFEDKLSTLQGTDLKQLKYICDIIDVDKKGSKEDIAEKILTLLLVPKDSGKPASGGAGRPKRTAAVRANNRGYSSHDDSDSDERMSPRGGRGKGRRTNLKDETSSNESDEDFQPSDLDSGDERPRRPTVSRRKRSTAGGGGRGRKRQDSDDDDDDDDELSDDMTHSSEDSEDEPKAKKRKAVHSKPKRGVPAKRGRKPKGAAPAKKTPAKRGRKKKAKPPSSEEEDSDRRSSSEDEPLVKKKSPQPPTDDEIKSYVKHILEGANLEEITMKTVCKQVYAHYPDFDLTHKKDYIKSTVKSLIST